MSTQSKLTLKLRDIQPGRGKIIHVGTYVKPETVARRAQELADWDAAEKARKEAGIIRAPGRFPFELFKQQREQDLEKRAVRGRKHDWNEGRMNRVAARVFAGLRVLRDGFQWVEL